MDVLILTLLSSCALVSMSEGKIPISLVLLAFLAPFVLFKNLEYEKILACMLFCVFFELCFQKYIFRFIPSVRIPLMLILMGIIVMTH